MQKCVRRRLPRDAARLAHALLAVSPSDALRRVAVMAAEDAAVHPRLPAVVWMMMAVAKGFALTADHTALVIRVVSDLAATRVRDTLPDQPPPTAGVPAASAWVSHADPIHEQREPSGLAISAASTDCSDSSPHAVHMCGCSLCCWEGH